MQMIKDIVGLTGSILLIVIILYLPIGLTIAIKNIPSSRKSEPIVSVNRRFTDAEIRSMQLTAFVIECKMLEWYYDVSKYYELPRKK